MDLPGALYDEIEAHARAELPNEACGIVTTRDGRPQRFHAARNVHESPMRFEIHPTDLYRIYDESERTGERPRVAAALPAPARIRAASAE